MLYSLFGKSLCQYLVTKHIFFPLITIIMTSISHHNGDQNQYRQQLKKIDIFFSTICLLKSMYTQRPQLLSIENFARKTFQILQKKQTLKILQFFVMPSYKEKKQKLRELVKQEEQQRKRVIQEEGHKFVDTDAFKRIQKHYKFYMHKKTDFSKLLKLQQMEMKQIQGKKVYKLPTPEGAYLVKGFSNYQEQYQIGFEALNRYIYRPYRTNLDGTNGLYQKEEEAQTVMQQNLAVQPEQAKDQNNKTLYYFNQKIRMSNLGYQYDWPKRSYPSTKVPVPQTILSLTERGISIFEQIAKTKIDYRGEAVIVNFYKPRDYMTGHLDDGEIDQKNPIFSYCYGLSCVFLIGYPQRNKQPVAVLLEAGDLMIMSGFSRICYHGVPRIIEDSFKAPTEEQLDFQLKIPENSEQIKFINQKPEITNYFKGHRLNINIRQVYPSQDPQKLETVSSQQKSEIKVENINTIKNGVKQPKVEETSQNPQQNN